MPIQIVITGDHSTDVIAEIQTLATALGVAPKNVAGATNTPVASTTSAPSNPAPASTSTAAPATGGKTLDRKAQDEAVKEMIAAGAKDARFDQLTKGRQQEIDKALAKPAETTTAAANSDADLDDMFGDDSAPAATTVTREQVSALMAKIGKDKDGNPIQPRLLKIREILVDNIPEGQEIKVKSLPEDKLATVYALIEKVGE